MAIKIKNKKIGENEPTFVIAEASANHQQNFLQAVKLIKAAKQNGVDAIKFQTYTPETLTIDIDNKYFRIKHPKWDGQTLFQLYMKGCVSWKWFRKLKKIADDIGIIFFSTAFDKSSVDLLETIDVPIHKISSFELVDLPLIEYIAKTKKPLILSTGMATRSEISEAVTTARRAGARDLILLKCTSCYPANPNEMNLKTIPSMKKLFNCPIGLSDHTLGTLVSTLAVSLGAQLIEKHFTLSRRLRSPDSFFSIEPKELKKLVEDIRFTEKTLGKVHYGLTDSEKHSSVFRRSLFVVKDIKKSEVITEDNVRSIRPAYGCAPKLIKKVLGCFVKSDIKAGTPLDLKLIKSRK